MCLGVPGRVVEAKRTQCSPERPLGATIVQDDDISIVVLRRKGTAK